MKMNDQIPSPKNVLRGHRAQIHSITFIRRNDRLVTGDADGYVSLWDLTIMRPKAVWKAHENAILGVRGWGYDKLITHGRDNKLIVWGISAEDEERLSAALPLESTSDDRPQPWILHLLEVNTMNFCSFACLEENNATTAADGTNESGILIAVPNTVASEAIDVWSLPAQRRLSTVRAGQKTGMAMCISLIRKSGQLLLLSAFEDGSSCVHVFQQDGQWSMTYRSQAHTQPVLSMDVHPDMDKFFTSSADAIIVKHPLPTTRQEVIALRPETERVEELEDEATPQTTTPSLLSATLQDSSRTRKSTTFQASLKEWEYPIKRVNTKHSGQQSLRVRSDGKVFATAGWDKNVRVYSAETLKELAVLQWHKSGCYAVAFANATTTNPETHDQDEPLDQKQPEKQLIPGGSTNTLSKSSVKHRRIRQANTSHWIASGSKDGKICLWDIY